MKISEIASRTFVVLNTISIILIVCMHSIVSTNVFFDSIVLNFIFKGLSRTAVPVFFLISAYLFFVDFVPSKNYLDKIKKRWNTLMIPYFITIFIYFLFYYITQQIPFLRSFYEESKLVENYTMFQIIEKIFIVPINPSLWFLRDLFLIYLLSPIIYYLNSNNFISICLGGGYYLLYGFVS